MRKHYIDNLRWFFIILLVPYHTVQAFNAWGEPNYIFITPNTLLSSFIVFFSPFMMPLLFLLAGMSTKFALNKRSYKEYIVERAKRLLIPLVFGTLVFMPVMCYLADKYNCGYQGSFFSHYRIFFTKITDLIGADGGFSIGQFWFLLYLFVISLLALGIIAIQKKCVKKHIELPLGVIVLLGLPLPLINDLLSIGGKGLVVFLYFFMLGYYVFSNDKIIEKIAKWKYLFLVIGLIADIADIYLFLWSKTPYPALNDAMKYITEWCMILALLGLGKDKFDTHNKVTDHLSRISFLFFSVHFLVVVVTQYLTATMLKTNTAVLFILQVSISFVCTFLLCEICVRVPALCFLLGVKPKKKTEK